MLINYSTNTIIEQFQMNILYEFDLNGQVSFGPLSDSEIHKLYRDGRVASKFVERAVQCWFPELLLIDGTGFDHIHRNTNRKYDLKSFTKGGASYAPSNMIGSGRKIDEGKMHIHASTIDYIFSDITDFPKVRIIFK